MLQEKLHTPHPMYSVHSNGFGATVNEAITAAHRAVAHAVAATMDVLHDSRPEQEKTVE